jgi:hypothetical protein
MAKAKAKYQHQLDSYIDARPRGQEPTRDTSAGRKKPATRETAAFHLPPELLDQARNTVVALAGPPEHLTMSKLVMGALTRELARLEKRHNKGRPFPKRAEKVRTGRPLAG